MAAGEVDLHGLLLGWGVEARGDAQTPGTSWRIAGRGRGLVIGGGSVDPPRGIARELGPYLRRLREAGGIFNSSRYLFTVRLATLMPSRDSSFDSVSSESGLAGSSAETSALILCFTTVAETSSPLSLPREALKK